jgi:phosphatidylserine/phosphatidylglycerophosphate/cardiolipin synthase-like enzyme
MKVIVQPEAGVNPILAAIKQARKSVDIVIFRLDRRDVANALRAAVTRGVIVRALIAHTNRGGEKNLRKLEMDLLEGGVTVSRTADDLVRYHGKMMIVDGRLLHLYGFNFTSLDITKSRSFGVVTGNKRLVLEASRLFAADFDRQPYTARHDRLIVSPANSRERLLAFIKGARRQLLIYDPQVSDDVVLKAISERLKSGVDIRLIGKVESKWNLKAEKFPGRRLHVRAIVRDGRRAFVGSQSLRKLELDRRREIGIIVIDEKVVKQIQAVFEQDWSLTESGRKAAKKAVKDGGDPGEPAARTGTYI